MSRRAASLDPCAPANSTFSDRVMTLFLSRCLGTCRALLKLLQLQISHLKPRGDAFEPKLASLVGSHPQIVSGAHVGFQRYPIAAVGAGQDRPPLARKSTR